VYKESALNLIYKVLLFIAIGCILAAMPIVLVKAEAVSNSRVIDSVEIISYELRNEQDEQRISTINPDDIVTIRVTIKDNRGGLKNNSCPIVFLNTSSFYPLDNEQKNGNAFKESGSIPGIYTLVFPVKYTGTGNKFTFDLSYSGTLESVPMTALDITFNQCVERTAEETEAVIQPDEVSEAVIQPDIVSEPVTEITEIRGTGFVLKEAKYGEGSVTAGKEFILDTIILATSGDYSVNNVNVTLNLPKEISLAKGSSVEYIGGIEPNESIPISFQLLSSTIAEEGSYVVTINIAGINSKNGEEIKTSIDISIPIIQPERFEIGNVQIPEYLNTAYDDGGGYTSIELVNKGKGTVYNVTLKIEGDGLRTDEGSQFIGNIASGVQGSADFNLKADEVGDLNGKVIVSYETSRGEEKQLEYEFKVTAEKKLDEMETDILIDPDLVRDSNSSIPWWVWILTVLGATIVIIVSKRLFRRYRDFKRVQQEFDEGDEDEDF